jgi:uncharacterized protein Yka (UPF0111/DUF47 family)
MWGLSRQIRRSRRFRIALVLVSYILLASIADAAAQASTPSKLTQLQLQSELMNFADLVLTFLGQSLRDPNIRTNPLLLGDQLLTIGSAVTIATSPNPEVGLLDMVVLITLGRIIYEEHYHQQYGEVVQPVLKALRGLETDIWRIASKVLTPAEQQDLRDLIHTWHRTHPTQTSFAYIRFSDFAEERQTFTVAESQKARGLFKSVQEATQKVDEIRLLAERGLYLATRLLTIFGPMLEVWVSRALQRPELVQLRGDVTQVSNAVDRAVQQVEQMPDHVNQLRYAAIEHLMNRVSTERQAAINQLMNRVSTERQALMQDLAGDEAGQPGVLPELEQTLTAGSTLATTVQGAVEALDTFATHDSERLAAVGKQPADVADIRALTENVAQAAQQLQGLMQSLNTFLLSPGWEQRLPQLLQVLDRTESEGEDFIQYTSARILLFGLLLVAAFLVSILIAGFILVPYIAKRFPGLSSRTS